MAAPCVFLRLSTDEFTALERSEFSASLSQAMGVVNPPSRKAGSVFCESTSLAFRAARWLVRACDSAEVRTAGPLPPEAEGARKDLKAVAAGAR